SDSPAMPGMRLRPQAESAHRRTAPRGVKRDVRIQKKRNVVTSKIQIALIYLGHPRKLIQVLDDAAFRIVHNLAILAVANAGQFRKRRTLGVVGDLVVEFAAD